MDCKAFRTEFEELETGEPLSATAQGHVDSCATCRAFQHERLSLGQLIKSLGAVNAPPDFDFRLRARLAAAKSTGNNSLSRARFAPGLKAISVAASFALLIAAAIVFKQSQPVQVSAPSQNPALAQQDEGLTQNPVNNSEPDRDSGQLAVTAAQGGEAANPTSNADEPKSGAAFQPKKKVERLAQAKSARSATPLKTERSPVNSHDLTFGGNAPVITPVQPKATNNPVNTDNAALLNVSSQPFKVLLHDRRGTMRSVSLERVIFGSQDFLEGNVRRRPLTSDVEGIW